LFAGPLTNSNNFLIVADWYLRNVYQIDANSGSVAQLLKFGVAVHPNAVAYDPSTQYVYWSDVELGTINKHSLLTNTTTRIYTDPTSVGRIGK